MTVAPPRGNANYTYNMKTAPLYAWKPTPPKNGQQARTLLYAMLFWRHTPISGRPTREGLLTRRISDEKDKSCERWRFFGLRYLMMNVSLMKKELCLKPCRFQFQRSCEGHKRRIGDGNGESFGR